MKQWLVGSSILLGIVLLLGAAYSAFSQDPRGEIGGQQQQGGGAMRGMPPGMMHMQMQQMKASAQGLFLLQGTTLRKFSTSLEAQGALELSEAKTTGRPQQATFLLTGDDVLVVSGSTLYRVDGKTLKVTYKKTLPDTTQTTTAANGQPQPPQPPATMELQDHTLYLMRGTSLVALSLDDGSILGKTTLPKPANAPNMEGGPMGARRKASRPGCPPAPQQ